MIIGQVDPQARAELNKTGMYQFGYNVCSPSERGQAIVGLYFDQSGTGHLYDPMNHDDALKVSNTNLGDFSRLVSDAAIVVSRVVANRHNA